MKASYSLKAKDKGLSRRNNSIDVRLWDRVRQATCFVWVNENPRKIDFVKVPLRSYDEKLLQS